MNGFHGLRVGSNQEADADMTCSGNSLMVNVACLLPDSYIEQDGEWFNRYMKTETAGSVRHGVTRQIRCSENQFGYPASVELVKLFQPLCKLGRLELDIRLGEAEVRILLKQSPCSTQVAPLEVELILPNTEQFREVEDEILDRCKQHGIVHIELSTDTDNTNTIMAQQSVKIPIVGRWLHYLRRRTNQTTCAYAADQLTINRLSDEQVEQVLTALTKWNISDVWNRNNEQLKFMFQPNNIQQVQLYYKCLRSCRPFMGMFNRQLGFTKVWNHHLNFYNVSYLEVFRQEIVDGQLQDCTFLDFITPHELQYGLRYKESVCKFIFMCWSIQQHLKQTMIEILASQHSAFYWEINQMHRATSTNTMISPNMRMISTEVWNLLSTRELECLVVALQDQVGRGLQLLMLEQMVIFPKLSGTILQEKLVGALQPVICTWEVVHEIRKSSQFFQVS